MAECKKTILVVDDEPEVRKLVGAMVNQFGYVALTADSGEHALTLCQESQRPARAADHRRGRSPG